MAIRPAEGPRALSRLLKASTLLALMACAPGTGSAGNDRDVAEPADHEGTAPSNAQVADAVPEAFRVLHHAGEGALATIATFADAVPPVTPCADGSYDVQVGESDRIARGPTGNMVPAGQAGIYNYAPGRGWTLVHPGNELRTVQCGPAARLIHQFAADDPETLTAAIVRRDDGAVERLPALDEDDPAWLGDGGSVIRVSFSAPGLCAAEGRPSSLPGGSELRLPRGAVPLGVHGGYFIATQNCGADSLLFAVDLSSRRLTSIPAASNPYPAGEDEDGAWIGAAGSGGGMLYRFEGGRFTSRLTGPGERAFASADRAVYLTSDTLVAAALPDNRIHYREVGRFSCAGLLCWRI